MKTKNKMNKPNEMQKAVMENWATVVSPHLPTPRLKNWGHDPRFPLRDLVGYRVSEWLPYLPKEHVAMVYIPRRRRWGSYHPHVSQAVKDMLISVRGL